MTHFIKVSVVGIILLSLLSACGGTERRAERRENRDATGQGAIGGAVLGATAGILLGDAELAVKGAAAGAVAGGVAGSAADYQRETYDRQREYENAQENERNATMAAAIASINSDGTSNSPEGWRNINAFIGTWQLSGTSVVSDGSTINFSGTASSRLDSTQSVTFSISDLKDSAGDVLPGSATITLDYTPADGFRLKTRADGSDNVNQFVGYFDNDSKRYVYFYSGGDTNNFTGISRADFQVLMRMVGNNVITAETVVDQGLDTRRIQTYKLTRQ